MYYIFSIYFICLTIEVYTRLSLVYGSLYFMGLWQPTRGAIDTPFLDRVYQHTLLIAIPVAITLLNQPETTVGHRMTNYQQ